MPRTREPEIEQLDAALKRRSAPAVLYERLDGGRVRCVACGHRCLVLPGLDGICRVRFNRDGVLHAPRGYVAGFAIDPVEKKPFFHVRPGAYAASFGMLGCDFHCPYCQNWTTSQTLRDSEALVAPRDVEPGDLVVAAKEAGARLMVSTYNEPLITAEWAVEVFQAARAAGLLTAFVSNGNGTPEALRYLAPWLDATKVDLKGFTDDAYRAMGGRLSPVLETIEAFAAQGIWLEVVTLVVPGFNDGEMELRAIARFLASLSSDIPWHVTAFHRDYKMTGPRDTSAQDLERAASFGREAGLRYVYAGNRPGEVGGLENTSCPACGTAVVERSGFRVLATRLAGNACATCGAAIAGRWTP